VSVTRYPFHKSIPTADAKKSASLFEKTMNDMKLDFEFDYAAAMIKY
jgi:hypothetical protein